MVLIGKNVLLQKLLKDKKLELEQFQLLHSLNSERLIMLYKAVGTIFRLREVVDLLEMKDENEKDIVLDRDNYYQALSKLSRADEILKDSVNYMEMLFELDSEGKTVEEYFGCKSFEDYLEEEYPFQDDYLNDDYLEFIEE